MENNVVKYNKPATGEIILYRPDNTLQLEVRLENETVWLTQAQIAELFGTQRPAITKHLNNIFKSGELDEKVVCSILELTTLHGAMTGKMQIQQVKFYNLDAILSVGYRVNSINATMFRRWTNQVLKNYLLQGYAVNQRFERLEHRVAETEKKIEFIVKAELPPREGILFEGQIFDAYVFACDLIKSAKKSIILLDNYIDESVLLQLSKRNSDVDAKIYTTRISPELQLDINRHNAQYKPITVETATKFHDRFLIIDNTIYFIGASLKDLGKKLFAFSKMELDKNILLMQITN
jgi:hypothetical protein